MLHWQLMCIRWESVLLVTNACNSMTSHWETGCSLLGVEHYDVGGVFMGELWSNVDFWLREGEKAVLPWKLVWNLKKTKSLAGATFKEVILLHNDVYFQLLFKLLGTLSFWSRSSRVDWRASAISEIWQINCTKIISSLLEKQYLHCAFLQKEAMDMFEWCTRVSLIFTEQQLGLR